MTKWWGHFTVFLPKNEIYSVRWGPYLNRMSKYQHREIKEGEGKMIKVVIAEDDFRIAQVQEQFCIRYQM